MHELIHDLALSIVMAWLLGVVAYLARQPLILAYLVAGFALGPFGLKWVHSEHSINTIAELGLIFMLFMIGLEIDLKKIIRAGSVILVTSAVQIIGCFALALGLFLLMGLTLGGGKFDALYLAAAVALSSTVIIVKVLYDKFELDTLPGRVTLGVLVLQDLFAILFLAIQPSLDNLQVDVVLLSLARVGVLLTAALLISRFTLPHLFQLIARLPELVLVGALAWCFAVAEFAEFLGLSREMGALVAGVSLSTFPYALDVTAKVTSLRDFFITLFFVALGMTIPLPTASVLGLALVIVAFTLASRLLTVFPPLYAMRQGIRASLLPAINLAQISEFSLVLIQVGVQANQVQAATASAASAAFVVLAVISTFLMMRSDAISRSAIPLFKRFGLSDLDQAHAEAEPETPDERKRRIVILGFYRVASSFLAELERTHAALVEQVFVVDFNPTVYHSLKARGVRVHYGDIAHADTLAHAGITDAEIVILSVPDTLLKGTSNERLVRLIRASNPSAKIIATADVLAETQTLYAAGADYVTIARLDQANELVEVVTAAEAGLIDDMRSRLEARLRDRGEILP
ncbi:MAG: cation:proton antiporter [Xanthobacteraceae bacterium]|nr:cation:proton antiporter [Xanthobacteraceae bacterium]